MAISAWLGLVYTLVLLLGVPVWVTAQVPGQVSALDGRLQAKLPGVVARTRKPTPGPAGARLEWQVRYHLTNQRAAYGVAWAPWSPPPGAQPQDWLPALEAVLRRQAGLELAPRTRIWQQGLQGWAWQITHPQHGSGELRLFAQGGYLLAIAAAGPQGLPPSGATCLQSLQFY